MLGLVAPPLAALPAIRRGARISVREGLEEVPGLEGGQAVVHRALRRLGFLPRTAQIGIRGVTRRARRSLTTGRRQIGLAVGTLLAVLALVNSVTATTNKVWNEANFDVVLNTVVGKQFDAKAVHLIRSTPGVADGQPMLETRSSSRARTPSSQGSRTGRCSSRTSRRDAGTRLRRLHRVLTSP